MTESESSPAAENEATTVRWIRDFLLRVYCRLLIMCTLYVLSIGPMFWYWYDARHMGQGSRAVVYFYGPLAVACENFKPLDDWVAWYINLWT